MEFHERLQFLREHKRPVVSRRVTSELMGLGHDALRKYERGEREPGLRELTLIAYYYEISLDELILGREKIFDFAPIWGHGREKT